jgi:SAM-dependent methyltransferase
MDKKSDYSYIGYPNSDGSKEFVVSFETKARTTPNNIAIQYDEQKLTYRELDEIISELSAYIKTKSDFIENFPVGILLTESFDCSIAMISILKAGYKFIVIDPENDEEQIKRMINNESISVIISSVRFIKTLNNSQWECNRFNCYICIDSDDVHSVDEYEKSKLMNKRLWEYVGNNSIDDITGGGWVNSYTRESFTQKEMEEFSNNILEKIDPYLHKKAKVLEIGCASGLSMFKIAPYVNLYYGTDLSNIIIEKNKQRLINEDIKNIKLQCLPAHEIDKLEVKNFDIVIMNSVIQLFHGLNYLRKVIHKSIDLLGEKGVLFIGDVMDLETKPKLLQSLIEYKQKNNNDNTKTDLSEELYVNRMFFEDLRCERKDIKNVYVSKKHHTIENELTKFRYDTIIEVDKKEEKSNEIIKHNYQYGLNVMKKISNRLS